jgi:hypothetical protein
MRRSNLLSFLALAAACGGGSEAGAGPVTRDSAGIAIVENTASAWASGQEWTVGDSVLLDIGGDIDSVSGPVRLDDGRLAIANAGTHQVRIYDPAGGLTHSSGRVGSGPGEYQMLAGIWRGPGDSLLVSDFMARRVSVLDREARFARSFSLGGGTGGLMPTNGRLEFAVPQGWFADGSVVGVTMSFVMNQTREGTFRDTVSALRYGPDGAIRDTIARFPGMEMEQVTLTMGTQSFSAPQPVPLGKTTITAARGDKLYLAKNDAWEVEVRQLDGKLVRLIRIDAPAVALSPAHVAAHRKAQREQLEAMPAMRSVPEPMKAQILARIDQAKYPATLAFLSAMLIDADGNLWAQELKLPGDETIGYAVLDQSGKLLGRVTMPAGFRATAIESNQVYGVWKDADDVEHLRAYPLRKGGPGR